MHAFAICCLLLTHTDDAPAKGKAPIAYAAKFSGQSYIRVRESANIIDLEGDFTVELWVRWDGRAEAMFCGKSAWPSMTLGRASKKVDNDDEKEIEEVTDECGWEIRGMIIKRRPTIVFSVGVEDKQWLHLESRIEQNGSPWHHVAVCRKQDELKMFVNGEPVANRSIKKLRLLDSPMDIHLGPQPYTNLKDKFDGSIRGFRVSSASRYDGRFKPGDQWTNDDETALLFDFLDVDGTTIHDASANGLRGECVEAKVIRRQVGLLDP